MEKCVEYGKTLAVAGETSTGKTTYMKMLIGYIPVHLRISTIEDNPEITFFIHKNYVHLFIRQNHQMKKVLSLPRRAFYAGITV